MQVTRFGQDGPAIGRLGLGCMGMSWAYDMAAERDEADQIAVIRKALELGMTLLDTADVYGPHTNEELVGRALTGPWRERAFLTTKVGLVAQVSGKASEAVLVPDGRPEHIRAGIDASLRRLGTDHLDLYQLHRVDPAVPLEESWAAMADVVAAGKARAIGLSHVSAEQVTRAHAIHPVASVESELSLWSRGPLETLVPACESLGITFLCYSPLGRGLLTGRVTTRDQLPAEDWRSRLPQYDAENADRNRALVAAIQAVAARVGASASQVALAWLLSCSERIVPIPGTKTMKYLLENSRACEVQLGEGDLAVLDGLVPAAQ